MSAILAHYSRNGVKILSKFIPELEQLSSDSLKYFDRTYLIASDSVKIVRSVVALSMRQVRMNSRKNAHVSFKIHHS